MKGLLFLVVCLGFVAASLGSIGFVGNVSASGLGTDDVQYRRTTVGQWSFGTLTSGVYFNSISLGRTQFSEEGDAVWGASWVGLVDVPLGFLSYWEEQANWDSGTDFINLNVSASAGFIASAYLALEERFPNDTIVAVQSLKNTLNPFGFQWSLTSTGTGADTRIKYAQFTGTTVTGNWNITLTHVISNVVGVINLANAVVSPKSFETIVTVNNWPYNSTQNHLVLILGAGSGSASGDSYSVISGSGSGKVYYRVGSTAVVNGVTKNVVSSGFSSDEYFGYIGYLENSTVFAQLNGKFGAQATFQLVSIKFPAGASQIIYDPDVGSGDPVSPNSGASHVSYGFALILLSVLFTFF